MSVTIECDRVHPVLYSNIAGDVHSLEEPVFQCIKVKNVENSVFVTNFSSVRNVNILNFPSIDNSEINGNYDSEDKEIIKCLKEPDDSPKDWKREKTFDGSPIYRVRSNFRINVIVNRAIREKILYYFYKDGRVCRFVFDEYAILKRYLFNDRYNTNYRLSTKRNNDKCDRSTSTRIHCYQSLLIIIW